MQNINPNQKVDVVDLSSQSQNVIDKKSLLSYINSLVGQNGITTKDKKAILNFIQKSYRIDKNGKGFNINVPRHIVYSSLKDNRAERSIVVNNIVDLIKQSVMIEVEKNTKKSEKPYVDEYYRFYVPVRINSDIYTIRLVAENQNKNNLFNIVKPSVYDVIIDKKRTSPKVTNAPVLRSPNNSINHSQQNASAEQITIRDMLSNVEDADGNIYFQSAVTAGAETSAEISDAQKEWQEKGTDSKYFKKWFGDSKVVDENGQPLVVYHGSFNKFSEFDKNKISQYSQYGGNGFFFAEDYETAKMYGDNVYPVYLKATTDYKSASKNGKKIDYIHDKKRGIWVVFSPEQIKSVDNRGTFDEGNPNIYYQSAYHGSPVKFDKFDHDYIGSGEGAQVHGYGTYVAESKHIADERYRERLVENKSAIEVGGDVYYLNDNGSWSSQDGEEYWDSDTYYGYILDVFNRTEDKEKSIKWLQDDLDEVLADKQEFVEENGLDGKLLEINSDNGFVNDGGEEYFDTIDEYLQRELRDYDDRISTYMRAVEVLKENDIKMYQGQLYEVEIPEDEEMLDEDLPFSEQPQKVQDAFGEMIKADQNGQLILLDSDMDESETPITSLSVGEIVSENPNGKKIYDRISSTIADVYGVDYAEADKLASELLNRYGIKGIKYNGQTDGQCYVIFNPENIDITRTFYQEGIKNSENINIDKEDYINAEKDIPLPNINHQVLKNLGKKNKPLILKSNIIKKNKKNHPEILIEEYNDILSKGLQSTDLVFKTDNKNEYYNFIHFDNSTNEQILVELSENKDNYEIVNFYKFSDKSLERKIKKANNEGGQFLITDSNAKGAAVLSALEVSPNNIITINSTNNKPKRTGYVFQEPAQPNLFVENAAQNHNKGFVGIDLKGNRGLTDINRNLILIGTTGDVTTVLHESAHYFLNMLEELERVPDHSPKVDDVLFAIRKTLKNDGTPFTRSQHEKFAKGFEHYIYTGNARSNIFKEIYEDIKNLLKNIYEFVQKGQYFTTGEGALTEEEMKNFNNVFDEIFKLENKTVKERVFAKVLALDEKEEDEETLFLSLFFAIQTPLPKFLI